MQAYAMYHEIRNAAAFSLSGKATRRNVNQHMREYTFPDKSVLRIYRKGYAVATDTQGTPQVICDIRCNAFGV